MSRWCLVDGLVGVALSQIRQNAPFENAQQDEHHHEVGHMAIFSLANAVVLLHVKPKW